MTIYDEMREKAIEHELTASLYRTIGAKELALQEAGMAMLCWHLSKPLPLVITTC